MSNKIADWTFDELEDFIDQAIAEYFETKGKYAYIRAAVRQAVERELGAPITDPPSASALVTEERILNKLSFLGTSDDEIDQQLLND